MAENITSFAILDSENRVVTFIRLEVPDGWTPPEGCTAIPNDELPEGWEYAPPSVVSVPESVSARQIRMWLILNGISLITVDTAINNISDEIQRDLVRVEWEYAPYIERTHPMLIPLASALGLTEQQVDQAFIDASIL